VNMFYVNLS